MNKVTLEEHLEALDKQYKTKLSVFWAVAKDKYEKLLSNIKMSFPFYSRHDASHAQTVVSNIEKVLGHEGIQKLDITDTWMILECAYIHDLGMLIDLDEIQSDWNSPMFAAYIDGMLSKEQGDLYLAAKAINKPEEIFSGSHKSWPLDITKAVVLLISEFYRPKHAIRSAINYTEKWIPAEQKNYIKPRLTKLVAKIASLHTSNFDNILSLEKEEDGQLNDYIHPRFIASLLRLGDVLDIDNNRFDNYLLQQLEAQLPEATRIHKGKHDAINKLLIKYDEIRIEADCATPEIYFEVNSWINGIKSEVNNCILYWDLISIDTLAYYPRVESKLKLNGKSILKGFENIKYDFSQEKMFEMIRGSNIYESEYVFIREFIQNALDASKLKLWEDILNGKIVLSKKPQEIEPWDLTVDILQKYVIAIRLKAANWLENSKYITFEIDDNGIGFRTSDILRIARIGNSWRENEAMRTFISNMPGWLRPTGSFGIGMQSAFLVANEITVLTINEDNQNMKLIFRSKAKGNEHILVLEDNTLINYRTRLTVAFVAKNDTLMKNRTTKFSQYLKDINPFKQFDTNLYWEAKFIREITSFLSFSFIPIHIETTQEKADYSLMGFNCNTIHMYNSIRYGLPLAVNENYQICIFEDNQFRISVNANSTYVTLWRKFDGVFFQYGLLSKTDISGIDSCRIFFKEMLVGNLYIGNDQPINFNFSTRCYKLNVSLWGVPAENCLLVNRSSIRAEYKDILHSIIWDGTKIMLEKLEAHIIIDPNISFHPLSIYCLYMQYNPSLLTEKLINALVKNSSDTEILVYRYNSIEKSYQKERVFLSQIIQEYPNLYFAETGFEQNFQNNSDMIMEIINKASIPWFIYQQPYTYWFENIPKSIVFNLSQDSHSVTIYNYKNKYTNKVMLKSNIDFNYSIMCKSDKYVELQVRTLPIIFSIDKFFTDSPPYIIYPHQILVNNLIVSDAGEHNQIDEKWLAAALSSLEKEGLFDYVYQHQVNVDLFSLSSIREGYRRLISDYWSK